MNSYVHHFPWIFVAKKEQLKPARNLLGAFQRSDAAFLELDEAQIGIQVVKILVMVKPFICQ
jgi:hypothetical protein